MAAVSENKILLFTNAKKVWRYKTRGDYFVYDFKTNTLIGQNTKEEYCLGDKVLIRVQKTDFEKKHIDFKILSKS